MLYLRLSKLEEILVSLRDAAEEYRRQRVFLSELDERWRRFVELARRFNVELKLVKVPEMSFYLGEELPDNADLVRKLNAMIAAVRRIREVYGDLPVIVQLDVNLGRVMVKV